MNEQLMGEVKNLLVEIVTSLPAFANLDQKVEELPPFLKLFFKGKNPSELLVSQLQALEPEQIENIVTGAKRIAELVG